MLEEERGDIILFLGPVQGNDVTHQSINQSVKALSDLPTSVKAKSMRNF